MTTKGSDNRFRSLTVVGESGTPATPASGDFKLYVADDGTFYLMDDTGTPTPVGGGGGLSDPMTTRGDIIVRNSSNVTARLATGAAGSVLSSDGTDTTWDTRSIQTFSPSWSGGTPSIGNGTLTGHYQKIADKLYWFNITAVFGSTTNFGSGGANYVFGNFPFTAKSTSPNEQVVSAAFVDTGTASRSGTARITAGTTATGVLVSADGTGSNHVTSTVPHTWANTDKLIIQGVVATD